MSRRLLNAQIHAVRKLLAVGRSFRSIARAIGVSRGSVSAIARGQLRPAGNRAQASPAAGKGPVATAQHRCPQCGGLTTVSPCWVCQIRAKAAPNVYRNRGDPAQIASELSDDERARAAECRQRHLERMKNSPAPGEPSPECVVLYADPEQGRGPA